MEKNINELKEIIEKDLNIKLLGLEEISERQYISTFEGNKSWFDSLLLECHISINIYMNQDDNKIAVVKYEWTFKDNSMNGYKAGIYIYDKEWRFLRRG